MPFSFPFRNRSHHPPILVMFLQVLLGSVSYVITPHVHVFVCVFLCISIPSFICVCVGDLTYAIQRLRTFIAIIRLFSLWWCLHQKWQKSWSSPSTMTRLPFLSNWKHLYVVLCMIKYIFGFNSIFLETFSLSFLACAHL